MANFVKVIDGKLICCKENHNQPIVMVAIDQGISYKDSLLCLKCFQQRRQVSKCISIEESQTLIQEKIQNLTHQQEEQKKVILKILDDFLNQMMATKSRVLEQIDQILNILQLWITDITNFGRRPDINNFIEDLQLLQSEDADISYQLNSNNQSYCQKIDLLIQILMTQNDYLDCQKILKNIKEIRIDEKQNQQQQVLNISIPNNQLDVNNVQLVSTVKQEEKSLAIASNNSGSIMVAGCGKDIKVWDFDQGTMIEKKRLIGHTENVTCLVFSKKHNWFASGSCDNTVRGWKETLNKDWVSTQPGKSHTHNILCLIMNKQENQLISGGSDNAINVWMVNYKLNLLELDYTLENKHDYWVYSLSLNESESSLVSSGGDKKIILWSNENGKLKYKHEFRTDDVGLRICFISENQFIWQQRSRGISNILEYNQGKLRKRSDLNLNLNQQNQDNGLFPTIKNKKKQIIIQKHNCYVYILKYQANGQLSTITTPIDCMTCFNYGSLTEDGEYLTIWNQVTQQFQVYHIIYK